MNQTIFENLPQKMNLISDLFSRVVFRDKEACQDLVRIILGEGYEVTGVTSQYDITNLQYRSVVPVSYTHLGKSNRQQKYFKCQPFCHKSS